MMDDINKHELIERYLLGELSGDILHTFTQKLATDEAFRKEVALEKAIIKNLQTAGRKEWALKLKNLHHTLEFDAADNPTSAIPLTEEAYIRPLGRAEETIEDTSTSRPEARVIPLRKRWTIWLAAASVVLILVTTFAVVLNLGNEADTLYQAYYEPYPEPSVVRGSTDQASLEKDAYTAYTQENYPRSIELLKQALNSQKNETALFYLGHAYMQSGLYEEAILTFEQYLQDYQELALDARWYLGLSYLKTGNKEAAIQQLQQVAATAETDTEARAYATKAGELLNELD